MAKKKRNVLKSQTESALRKKYAGSGLAEDIVLAADEMLWLPSRFLALNYQWGGGIPYGKIVEIYGEESSGKSLLAFDFAYCCQQLGGQVLWADAEFAFTRDWSLANGLKLEKVELFKEKAIETISDWSVDMAIHYRSKLVNNEPILLVVDSVAALDCLVNMNSSQVEAKAEMGNRAKQIDMCLRTRNGIWEDLGVSVIFINQLRKKIGATNYEDPDTTPGGMALRFYASIRAGVYGGKQITGKINGIEERIGKETSIRIKKNKVAPPRPTMKGIKVNFHPEWRDGVGFDKYFGLPEALTTDGVIYRKKGSSKYRLGGEDGEIIANGELAFLKKLKTDKVFRKMLMDQSSINTISKTKAQAKAIGYNLYELEKGIEDYEKHSEEDEEE